MHASCDSPWHLSAKRRVLDTCLLLTSPFRSMLLTWRGGPPCLTPRAHGVPVYSKVLRHSYSALSRRSVNQRWNARLPPPLRACRSPKVTTSLGQRCASGCLGMARSCSSTSENNAVIKSMVVVIDSSVPLRVARLQPVWRKCMTTTIRPVSTMVLIGLYETNTIGYYACTELGQRLFHLPLGPLTLACVARNRAEDHEQMDTILEQEGREGFAAAWLRAQGFEE